MNDTLNVVIAFVGFLMLFFGGLSLTCFLITFGAPFWKDVMNSLVGIKKTVFSRQ